MSFSGFLSILAGWPTGFFNFWIFLDFSGFSQRGRRFARIPAGGLRILDFGIFFGFLFGFSAWGLGLMDFDIFLDFPGFSLGGLEFSDFLDFSEVPP